MSPEGKYIKKAIILAINQGYLLENPVLYNVPETKYVIVCWNEYGVDGYSSKLMKFNVEAPHSEPKILTTISISDKSWDMVRNIFPSQNGFTIMGYNLNIPKAKYQHIFKLKLNEFLALDGEPAVATKSNLRESSALSATPAKRGKWFSTTKLSLVNPKA